MLHTAQAQSPYNDEPDDGLVRMQSGKKKLTNATILRKHINQVKEAFSKFNSQHNRLVQQQKAEESPKEEHTCDKSEGLALEVAQLRKQLAERDALIVKLSKGMQKKA